MKTTLTLAMALTSLPAFAAMQAQREILTYDDIIHSRGANHQNRIYHQNLSERKARLDEEKRILRERERILNEERLIQYEEERMQRGQERIPFREERGTSYGEFKRFGIEIAGVYNIACSDFVDGVDDAKVNTWGGDITGVYHINENNAITLRLGVASGNKSKSWPYESAHAKLLSVALMPGYRYTWHPSDVVSIYAGANIGLGHMRVDLDYSLAGHGMGTSTAAHETGFAYSAEIGLQCALSENISLFAAYQYSGYNFTVDFSEEIYLNGRAYLATINTKKQNYNTFRVGIEVRF